ncbi:MAG: GNAT family N-acetyltransferase [Steroidobacterales bacterium]
MEPVTIQPMQAQHWPGVRSIYQAGIDTGHATFESRAPESFEQWLAGHVPELCLVALSGATPLGWAALSRTSSRCIYAGVAEESVYVDPTYGRRGVGRSLLAALIAQSEDRGYWTLQAGIFPENTASVALHRALGFEPIGLRRRIGRMSFGPMAGRWRDVLHLERRSPRIGVD